MEKDHRFFLDHPDISVKVAQSLARHSSVTLTLDTYTHPKLHSERAALDVLPKLPNLDRNRDTHNRTAVLKTGTDNLPTESDKISYRKLTGENYFDRNKRTLDGTARTTETDEVEQGSADCNLLETAQLGSDLHESSSGDIGMKTTTPDRTRTCDLRFRKPMLYPTELRAHN